MDSCCWSTGAQRRLAQCWVAAPDRSRIGPTDDSGRCAAGPASRRATPRGAAMPPAHSRSRSANNGNGVRSPATPTSDTTKWAGSRARPARAGGSARAPQPPADAQKGLGQVVQQLIEWTCQHRRPRDDHVIVARAGRSREHLADRCHQPPACSIAGDRLANSPTGGKAHANLAAPLLRRRPRPRL